MFLILFGLFVGWSSNQTMNFEECKKNNFETEMCSYSKKLNKLGGNFGN